MQRPVEHRRFGRAQTAWALGASSLALLHAFRAFETANSDDAFILFRYARNLAAGHGIVWNAGEPPVEGFTSLLHVLVIAAGAWLGADPVAFGQVVGTASAALACGATVWLAFEAWGGDRLAGAIAALAVATSPSVAAWARGGMETLTFTALVALGLASWLRDRRAGDRRLLSSIILFLATLSRPEGLGIAAVSILWDLAESRERAWSRRILRTCRAWLPYGVPIVLYGSWKLAYLGELLPTTWQAKSGGGVVAVAAGTVYVLKFLRSCGVVTLLLGVLPLVIRSRSDRGSSLYLIACAAVLSAPAVAVGGDYQYFHRYLVPVVPIVAVLAGRGGSIVWEISRGFAGWRRVALAVALIVGAAVPWARPSIAEVWDRPWLLARPFRLLDLDRMAQDDFIQMGHSLSEVIPEGKSLAVIAVGAIGYYCDRPIIDMMGLNDAEIARAPLRAESFDKWRSGHMRGDARLVLRRQPDFIVPVMRPTKNREGPEEGEGGYRYPFLRDLMASDEFRAYYAHVPVQLEDGRWIQLYRRSPAGVP